MATDQTVIYRFDWGEPVKITDNAPEKYLAVAQGSVCGIRQIDTEGVAKDFGEPIGTVLYLVEGSAGEAIEIPERFLVAF
jgi:hypothetical protein